MNEDEELQRPARPEPPEPPRPRPRRTKRRVPVALLTAAAVILAAAGISAYKIYRYIEEKNRPNFEIIELNKYYNQPEGLVKVIIGDSRSVPPHSPIVRDGLVYLPSDFVAEHFDERLFFDGNERVLIISYPDAVYRFDLNGGRATKNDREYIPPSPLFWVGDIAYLPIDLPVEFGGFSIEYSDAYNMVIIDELAASADFAAIGDAESYVRYEPDIKSPSSEILRPHERARIFGEDENYFKVRTKNGAVGWVSKKESERVTEAQSLPAPYESAKNRAFGTKLNIVFDAVYNVQANSNENRRVVHDGLDVLSPTWFSFDKALDGGLVSLASPEYVEWAHSQNYEVWALITDNFDPKVTRQVLSSTSTRKQVIDTLLAYIDELGLDGINIDFENVPEDSVVYYHQFLRELYPLMLEKRKILSVDMYVPMPHSLYYNRAEVARSSDYIVVMAYDEHWSTSPTAGPVASIGFVENGVAETLKEADKSKILLGMPYYVRVWRVTQAGEVSSRNYYMEGGKKIFDDKKAPFIWDDIYKCYYSHYDAVEDGEQVTYKVWLEDERSIAAKLEIAMKYDVAGVAGWSRGMEKESVWGLIKKAIKQGGGAAGDSAKWTDLFGGYVAHALGAVNGVAETNSREALEASYAKGFRVFEVDLNLTTDGELVAVHDWASYSGPKSVAGWANVKIADVFHSLSLAEILDFMEDHPDMYIITDTKSFEYSTEDMTRQLQILYERANERGLSVLRRVVPQLYNQEMYAVLRKIYPYPNLIYTLYASPDSNAEVIAFVKNKPEIPVVAMAAARYSDEFRDELLAAGKSIYLYTLNDADEVAGFRKSGVHGFYTDFLP